MRLARKRFPTLEAVIHSVRNTGTVGYELALRNQPFVRGVAKRLGPWLAKLVSLTRIQVRCFTLDVVERREEGQCLPRDLTAVVRVQLEELSACMIRASDLGDALEPPSTP